MPVSDAAREALAELVSRAAALCTASGGNLLECLALVPDPRDPRGIRHALACVLALCTAAVLPGDTSFEDVAAWVYHAGQEVLAACGARRNGAGILVAPHRTRWSGSSGSWARPRSRTAPGRTWRCGNGAARSRSRPQGRAGCRPWRWKVITADAARTVKAHARLICGELLAHYVLTVKLSTRKLYEELDALDWAQVPRLVREERGHGRWERRTIQVMDAPAHVKKAVPARPPGRSRRAVRHPHHPHEDGKALGPPGGEVRGRGAHHHQPQRAGGVPASPGRLCPRPLDDREQGPLGP